MGDTLLTLRRGLTPHLFGTLNELIRGAAGV
jgi:hypothetical protein